MKQVSSHIIEYLSKLKEHLTLGGQVIQCKEDEASYLLRMLKSTKTADITFLNGLEVRSEDFFSYCHQSSFFVLENELPVTVINFLGGAKAMKAFLKAVDALEAYGLIKSQVLFLIDGGKLKKQDQAKIDKIVARVTKMNALEEKDVLRFILKLAKKWGLAFQEKTAQALFHKLGSRLVLIEQEIEKLALIVNTKSQENEAHQLEALIDRLVLTLSEEHVFAISDALLTNKVDRSISVVDKLLAQGESPGLVVSLLFRHFSQALTILSYDQAGKISQLPIKLPKFVVNRYRKYASSLGESKLKRSLSLCVDAEGQFKSTSLSAELLIYDIIYASLSPR